MMPKQSNPTQPRRDNDQIEHWARAPYNFIPLPEKMILARSPLDHDHYAEEGLTGWIECELETCSPTYVRGMLDSKTFAEQGEKKADALSPEEKVQRAPFYSYSQKLVEGWPTPSIPGSSLRGMLRILVEVAGYGRIRYVAKEPAFTFRAVAAAKEDPLREPYRHVIGAFGRNVQVGYLEHERTKGDDGWSVRPALSPKDLGWPDQQSGYLKVKETQIDSKDIPGFKRFNSSEYRPQIHEVSFNVEIRKGSRGSYLALTGIGVLGRYQHRGVLVCSGNMLETQKEMRGRVRHPSPRKNHALVLERNLKAPSISIDPQAIRDYRNGMTPFQQDELKDWSASGNGCLSSGKPVFYVVSDGKVTQFGHSPNFRISARQSFVDGTRAATPFDFIPVALWNNSQPDLAEAIFGWVEDQESNLKGQRAGRVTFSDATLVGHHDGMWYHPEPISPHVLAAPKPTTFQHYLVQDARKGHDPDRRSSLAHYGTPPGETAIRGHKFYWFKGADPDIEADSKEREHETQLTRIIPLKPKVRFKFKIHFDNLREEELGALWWALTLPGEADKTYRHHLGMGRPLGMGAVELRPHLVLTRRIDRYTQLFSGTAWNEGVEHSSPEGFLKVFEGYVLDQLGAREKYECLYQVERIQALLTLLEWEAEVDEKWLDMTRYMEVEHASQTRRGLKEIDEYKEDPVLPSPQAVRNQATGVLPSREEKEEPATTPGKAGKETPFSRPKGSKVPASGAISGPLVRSPIDDPTQISKFTFLQATVDFVEDNGDVYLVITEIPAEKALGRVKAAQLGGKKYQEGLAASVMVVDVLQEHGETIIECEVPGVSEYQGVVKRFGLGADQSYGFIQPDDADQDLFVHRKHLRGITELFSGQRVVFKVGKGMRGPQAIDVSLI